MYTKSIWVFRSSAALQKVAVEAIAIPSIAPRELSSAEEKSNSLAISQS